MADLNLLMPPMARNKGVWEGRYRHVDPAGAPVESYGVRCTVDLPDDGETDFRLTAENRWDDGRTSRVVHEAIWRDDRLWFVRGGLNGWMKQVDADAIYLAFGFEADPALKICEMIQISADGAHRARTWHWFRDGVLFKVTLVDEKRVG